MYAGRPLCVAPYGLFDAPWEFEPEAAGTALGSGQPVRRRSRGALRSLSSLPHPRGHGVRVLFVTWDGGGNEPPAIGAAEALRDRGHAVTLAGYETQRQRIEARGLWFVAMARASAEFFTQPWPRPMPALVMASDEQAADVRQLLSIDPPDVVVVDCLLFGALAAVEAAGVPSVVFVHNAPSLLLPPGGLIDRFLSRDIAELRAAGSLPPVESLQEAWAGAEVVATTIPEMDEPASAIVRYVGPIVPRSADGSWTSPWGPSDTRPLVVASFTTGGGWDQRSRIERTVQALADAPVRVLATIGQTDVAGLEMPANAALAEFVPHAYVMPRAAVVVTHGGHGTVMAALAHGVPLACLPNPFSDQPAVAERVAELGAGIALDGEAASSSEIRHAVEQLLLNPSFAGYAARLAESVRSSPGAAGVTTVVEQVGARVR